MKFNYSELKGYVVTKESYEYEESRKCWNRAIQKYPLVIVYCHSNDEIINAIDWAKKNSLPIRIRSGSHNYEGFSTGNDVVVIDTSRMNKIEINEEKNIVKIQGGVRNRELYEFLGSRLFPFPGGGCPTVGIAGLVLGGGWGYSSRYLGLACDSLIELEIINYRGKVLRASNNENEMLFWACKGAGGGNFGVVTSMTFKLPNIKKMATLIEINCSDIVLEEKIELVKLWQKKIRILDSRINMKMAIYNSRDNGKGIKITGLFYGTKEECNRILNPFKEVVSNINQRLDYISVLEANRRIQDSHPEYERYKSTGRFVYKNYNDAEIEKLIKITDDRAKGATYTAISFYGLGGAVLNVAIEDSAVFYRDANSIIGFQSVWEEDIYADENRGWVIDKFEFIKSLTKGSFINFPIKQLDNYHKEYYGENFDKLRDIKKEYDPECIFTFEQGI